MNQLKAGWIRINTVARMDRKEIFSLTGLRGVAAIWVLAMHIRNLSGYVYPDAKGALSWIANAGYLGVDIFFALNCFVLAYSYPTLSRGEYLSFVWKRLARIYPIHLATLELTAISAVALGSSYPTPELLTTDGLLASLTLTHGWAYPIRALGTFQAGPSVRSSPPIYCFRC